MMCLCHLTVCKACFVTSQPVTPVSSSVLLYVLSLKLRHFRKEKVYVFLRYLMWQEESKTTKAIRVGHCCSDVSFCVIFPKYA